MKMKNAHNTQLSSQIEREARRAWQLQTIMLSNILEGKEGKKPKLLFSIPIRVNWC